MYTETGLLFPYFQNFSQELQQLEEYCKTQKPNASRQSDLVQVSSNVSEYDLGREGDLFKAPETIIEEPGMGLDPMAAVISMISCSEDAISPRGIEAVDMDSLDNEQILNNVFYECEKKLLEEEVIEASLFDILDIKIPILKSDENQIQGDKPVVDLPFQKSVSSGSLSSMDWMRANAIKPAFLDFPGMDFSVYGMRRAYSEGDVKTLGNLNASVFQSPPEKPILISNCTSEERQEKLSRYRNKKTKRNFGRKIKYSCRKALADSQPRIRGRFAKTEECDAKRQ